ncbi:hypothetical protein NBRC116601_12980 [Cognatishimia sp. WU-CL00825]|uniref:hypothetical protein n=1 Tax=Cognatishimia sp. WU-CL00825 TaxID=3127658 RepID=UPI00310589B7
MRNSRIALTAALGATAATAHAETDAWNLLEQIQIKELVTETSYEVQKTYPSNMDTIGKDIKISGYAVPMYPGDQVTELLLVSDMGLCPLCGNSEHGANLQVTLAEPISVIDESQRIVLRGDLIPVRDPETWQAAILKNARIVTQ